MSKINARYRRVVRLITAECLRYIDLLLLLYNTGLIVIDIVSCLLSTAIVSHHTLLHGIKKSYGSRTPVTPICVHQTFHLIYPPGFPCHIPCERCGFMVILRFLVKALRLLSDVIIGRIILDFATILTYVVLPHCVT